MGGSRRCRGMQLDMIRIHSSFLWQRARLGCRERLKKRIAAHEQEVEAAAEKAVHKAVEAQRTSASSRKRPPPAGAEVIKLEEDSPGEGAGGGKPHRREQAALLGGRRAAPSAPGAGG